MNLAARLAELAMDSRVPLAAIYKVLGISDVTFLNWRRESTFPAPGDTHLMQIMVRAITELRDDGRLPAGGLPREQQTKGAQIFTDFLRGEGVEIN